MAGDEKCPNCGALGTVGDPHDPDCLFLPVYAMKDAGKGACFHARAARHLDSASFAGSRRTYKYYCIDCGVWSSEPMGPWVEVKATPLVDGNSIAEELSRIKTLLTQADEVYWRALGDDVRQLKVTLAEALARKPLVVAETRAFRPNDSGTDWVRDGVGSSEEEKMIAHNHVHRRIDELSDKLLKLAAFVTARFEADSAALDSHERRLVTFDGVMGEHETILDSHNNTLDLMNNALDRHSKDLVSMFDRLSKLEAIEAQRRGDAK